MEISNLLTILYQASWKSSITIIQGISSVTHDSRISNLLTILCQASWFASISGSPKKLDSDKLCRMYSANKSRCRRWSSEAWNQIEFELGRFFHYTINL
jgi:hypothetical protein